VHSADQAHILFQVVAALGFSVDLGLAVVLPCSDRYSAPGADLLFPSMLGRALADCTDLGFLVAAFDMCSSSQCCCNSSSSILFVL
jgi:hypothetical protein